MISFNLLKQRSFNNGQMYVALCRVTSLNGLFLTGQYKSSAIKADPRALQEYDRMRKEYSYSNHYIKMMHQMMLLQLHY